MLRIEHFHESLAIQLWYRPLSSLPAVSIASGYFRDVTRDQLTQFPQGAVLRHGQLGHVRDQHVSRQKGLTFICEVRLQDNNKNNSNNKLLSLEKKSSGWICTVGSNDFSLRRVFPRCPLPKSRASSAKSTKLQAFEGNVCIDNWLNYLPIISLLQKDQTKVFSYNFFLWFKTWLIQEHHHDDWRECNSNTSVTSPALPYLPIRSWQSSKNSRTSSPYRIDITWKRGQESPTISNCHNR